MSFLEAEYSYFLCGPHMTRFLSLRALIGIAQCTRSVWILWRAHYLRHPNRPQILCSRGYPCTIPIVIALSNGIQTCLSSKPNILISSVGRTWRDFLASVRSLVSHNVHSGVGDVWILWEAHYLGHPNWPQILCSRGCSYTTPIMIDLSNGIQTCLSSKPNFLIFSVGRTWRDF